MKKKTLIVFIVLIILFCVSNVFAATSNTVESLPEELSEEDLIPALEEELKEKQELENKKESNSDNVISDKNTNSVKNDSNSIKTDSTKTEIKNNSKKEKILSDIYIAESNNDVIYDNKQIEGNIYIITSKNVKFRDCNISGNIFVFSNLFELDNTKLEGSLYVVSNDVNFVKSKITSSYIAANSVNADVDTEVLNDVRIVANVVNFLGDINRDSFIQVFESSNIDYSVTIQDILPNLIAKFAIILVIAIVVLGGFPKFVGVNLSLGISSFFKAFFTGIIEIIIIALISLTLMILGLGAGYGFAILILLSALVCFGKAIFIIAFALRLVRNKGKNARVKAFIYTIFVSAVVIALDLLVILGETGFLATLIINIILAITGFGTLLRVIFTSKVKKQEVPKVQEVASAPIEPETPKNVSKPIIKEAELIPNEVKKDAPIEHNLRLEIENVTEDGKRPEVYEITGKIIKRRIYPEEDIEKSEEVNLTENLTDEQEKTKKQIQDEEEKTEE